MALHLSSLPLREQALLTLGCCFMVALAADRLVVAPMLVRLDRLDTEFRMDQEQLRSNRMVLQLETPVAEAYAAVRDRIGASGPETEAIELLKGNLDELARRSGISLRAMQHSEPVRSEFLVTYTVEVSDFSGEMVNLLAFFKALHEFPGMLRVARLRMTANTESSIVGGAMVVTKVMTTRDAMR